jgi:hypothetical protein
LYSLVRLTMQEQTINLLTPDYVSFAFQVLGTVFRERLLAEYEQPSERIVKARLKYCKKDIPILQENAVSVLKDILNDLEQELRRRISKHSSYYWLFLHRRVAPWPVDEDDKITAFLYRNTLDLAIVKYGKAAKKNEFRVVSGQAHVQLFHSLLVTTQAGQHRLAA